MKSLQTRTNNLKWFHYLMNSTESEVIKMERAMGISRGRNGERRLLLTPIEPDRPPLYGKNRFKMRSSKSSVLYLSYPTETSLIDVSNYFDEYRKLLPPVRRISGKSASGQKKLESQFYQEVLGLSSEEIGELEEATSIDKLTCPGEITPINHALHESDADFHMKYEMALKKGENHNLVSVKKRMEVTGEIYSNYNLKYGHYAWLNNEEFPTVKEDLNPYDFSTVVFCVKVYHPYLSYPYQRFRVKLLQEIHILGNQFLSELKDKILCTMDYNGITDVSDIAPTKKRSTELIKRENYLSSFIFIENQFFNDTRSNCKSDLSKTIIEWAKSKQIGPFTTESMEKTRMLDLKLKVGHPYVYQHQGDCEHIIYISDIRFLQVDDPLKTCNFPRVYAKGRCSGRFCMMCGVAYAMWLVTGNARLTHDKSYFCNRCFISYNYIDGQKIGNFKAYEYIDPIALL